jgi:carbamoyl-phosphate synthase/aspartate carbamoyltransferase
MSFAQPVPAASSTDAAPSQPAVPASLVPHVPSTTSSALPPRAQAAGSVTLPASSRGFDSDDQGLMNAALKKGELVEEWKEGQDEPDMVLELADGLALSGTSFGAEGKSISGECVFQTGEFGLCRNRE